MVDDTRLVAQRKARDFGSRARRHQDGQTEDINGRATQDGHCVQEPDECTETLQRPMDDDEIVRYWQDTQCCPLVLLSSLMHRTVKFFTGSAGHTRVRNYCTTSQLVMFVDATHIV